MASAQTSKGRIIVGGNVSFNSWKNTTKDLFNNPDNSASEFKITNIGFYPSIGYFIIDKFAVGIAVGLINTKQIYKTSTNSSISEEINKNKNTIINIFAKKYFLNENNFGFYTGLSIGAGPSKGSSTYYYSNYTEPYSTSEGISVKAGLDFGLAYFLTPKVSLHIGIAGIGWNKYKGKYTRISTGEETNYDSENINLNINSLVLSLGISYIFGF